MAERRREAEMVMFGSVEHLLKATGTKPQQARLTCTISVYLPRLERILEEVNHCAVRCMPAQRSSFSNAVQLLVIVCIACAPHSHSLLLSHRCALTGMYGGRAGGHPGGVLQVGWPLPC